MKKMKWSVKREEVAGLSYSRLRGKKIAISNASGGIREVEIVGAVWRKGQLSELICFDRNTFINAFVG